MTDEQQKAVQILIEGLAFYDSFPHPPDDAGVFAESNNCLYEFAVDEDRLQVGHLREIASLFTKES